MAELANTVKLVLILVLALLVAVLVLQNTDTVETRVLFVTMSMPQAVLLFVTALFGFVLGILVSLLWLRGDRRHPAPTARRTGSGPGPGPGPGPGS